MKRCASLLLIIVSTLSCSPDDAVVSKTGNEYLHAMLDFIELNSAYTTTIDWTTFRNDLEKTSGDLPSIPDAYPFVKKALEELNDPRSAFTRDGYVFKLNEAEPDCNGQSETTTPTIDNIGFIKVVGSFSGGETQYQKMIKDQDNKDLKGWIVDLRGVSTNEIWPMLAGLGPILGDGLAGYYIDVKTQKSFGYQAGKAMENGNVEKLVVTTPYTLINKNPKVAVLINSGTTYQGEAMAIAFKGRANTKFFGEASCGAGNNRTFDVPEYQTVIRLTTEFIADRSKNKQLSSIIPDVPANTNTSEIYEKAAAWINGN